ncbi:M20/M25/M40 family metallo-hydrolase [Saxibacter everestensis]|uniref:M20/M25/M40 family metallo-hydrolase n=1 Tax=Saxibacter everestensis TaxID=2909229 RepID=A0ABY8QQ40_9MICO|nr:M20/M25/M40 family metallo-hydrolase [Brevibacteriaceae bacterium ZFBP1038]
MTATFDLSGQVAELESLVARYVSLETPTGDPSRIGAFVDELEADLTGLGGKVRRESEPTGDHLVADFPGRGTKAELEPILLLGHYDTVHPAGSLSGTMPLRRAGDTLFGPGVYDMKSGLALIMTALDVLNFRQPSGEAASHRPLRVVFNADEEIGSPTSRRIVELAAEAAVCALGFEAPHPDGSLKLGRWGSTRARVTVTGKEAHAALDPDKGVNAIDELVDQLTALRAVVDRHHDGMLCNVGTISGGGKTNVVPASATAEIGFRFRERASESGVLGELAKIAPLNAGAEVAFEVVTSRPAWQESAQDRRLANLVLDVGRDIGQTLDARPARGAADTNFTGGLGIPTLDGFGPLGQGAHAEHEQIHLPALGERLALILEVLTRL